MLAPPVTSSASPSNAIRFGKLKLNKKNGTATLTITVSSPGSVVLSGAGVKKLTKAAKRAGSVALTVRLTGKAEGKLTKTGKAKVKSKVTFTPTGGIAATKMKTLTLKKTLG
jgi:hypothetical protein